MTYPAVRLRRLRRTAPIRNFVAETRLHPSDFILPFFLLPGKNRREAVPSMPGVHQQTVEHVLIETDQAMKLGIQAVMLFGIPEEKDTTGSSAFDSEGVIQHATQELKKHFGTDLIVMTDTCLCEYTSHGHCGVVMDNEVLNDPSVELLAKIAVSQAAAGADVICPSDMMDGRVQTIRWALEDAGFTDTLILAYAAKYASHLYAPFRDAAESTPAFGDRRTYQMDFRSRSEALREVDQDVYEGADMLMIKPALAYLDILRDIREETLLPLVAYNVSGEYAMVKAAAQNGWLNEANVVLELLTGIKRAGATKIVTYHAIDASRWLN